MTATDCPECRAGKHANCDGCAWDDTLDVPAVCDCWDHGHDQSGPPCARCGEPVPICYMPAHYAADHGDLAGPLLPEIVDRRADVDVYEQCDRQTAYERTIYGD